MDGGLCVAIAMALAGWLVAAVCWVKWHGCLFQVDSLKHERTWYCSLAETYSKDVDTLQKRLDAKEKELAQALKRRDDAETREWISENLIQRPDWRKPIAIDKQDATAFVRRQVKEGQ